jgi:hypothetical protein
VAALPNGANWTPPPTILIKKIVSKIHSFRLIPDGTHSAGRNT